MSEIKERQEILAIYLSCYAYAVLLSAETFSTHSCPYTHALSRDAFPDSLQRALQVSALLSTLNYINQNSLNASTFSRFACIKLKTMLMENYRENGKTFSAFCVAKPLMSMCSGRRINVFVCITFPC